MLVTMVQFDWSPRGPLFLIETSQTFRGLLLNMPTGLPRDRKTVVYKKELPIKELSQRNAIRTNHKNAYLTFHRPQPRA